LGDNLSAPEASRKKKTPETTFDLPATPETTTAAMDSEDDFSSQMSEAESLQDSDIELDDGKDQEASSSTDDESDTWTVDSDFDMEDQDDVGFSQDKDIKPSKHAYEVDFKVFEPSEIQASQNKQIGEVSNIIVQPPEATAILLRHMRWNKERLIDRYMEKPEEILESAGLGDDASKHPPTITKVKGFCCDICCEDDADLDTFAMKCDHRFCVYCYRQYLHTKIKDEGEAARIQCPGDKCSRILDSKSLDLLVGEDLRDRYVSGLRMEFYH
jgi:ariadne-1